MRLQGRNSGVYMFSEEEMQVFGGLLLLSIAICVACPPLEPIGVLGFILTLAAAIIWFLLKLTLMLALAVVNGIAEFVAQVVTGLADVVMVAAQGLAGLGQGIYQFISSLWTQDADVQISSIVTATAVRVTEVVPPLAQAFWVVEDEGVFYLKKGGFFSEDDSSCTPSAPPANLIPGLQWW